MKTADMDHGSHMLPSRHLRSMHEKIGNEELHVLEFCQAAAPILEQVNKFRKHPVSWQGDGPGTGLPVGVMTALWNLVEHYAPGFLSHPGSQNPAAVTADASSPPSAGRTSCAMCCADMQSSNGTCDVCSTVKPVFNDGGGLGQTTHTKTVSHQGPLLQTGLSMVLYEVSMNQVRILLPTTFCTRCIKHITPLAAIREEHHHPHLNAHTWNVLFPCRKTHPHTQEAACGRRRQWSPAPGQCISDGRNSEWPWHLVQAGF